MSARRIALAMGALTLLWATLAGAEPIMKPRKYHGPIPQSMVWLRAGMFGGASNEEMNTYLDGLVHSPFTATSEDFGTSLAVDAGYAHKPHPQFAVRLNASISFLSSPGNWNGVAAVPNDPDSIVVVNYTRDFDSKLIVLEASGLYFFSDAAVEEFQTYIGGGFSFGIPYETFTETQSNAESGEVYYTHDSSEWGFSPGVHAILGALYYIDNQFAITAEGRVQQMKGRYEQLQAVNETFSLEDINFEIDYAGFYLTVGMVWGF